jgi:hypothetical protein
MEILIMKTTKHTILMRIFVLGTLFLALFFPLPKCESVNANEKRDDISFVATDVETPIHDHQPAEEVQNSKRLWCNEHGVYEMWQHLYMITDRQKRLKTQIDCGVMNTVFMKMNVLFAILN